MCDRCETKSSADHAHLTTVDIYETFFNDEAARGIVDKAGDCVQCKYKLYYAEIKPRILA